MKQSVYLGQHDHARWKALGISLGEVIRAGLDALEAPVPQPGAPGPQPPVPRPGTPAGEAAACSHPSGARLKGRCTRCRTFVGY